MKGGGKEDGDGHVGHAGWGGVSVLRRVKASNAGKKDRGPTNDSNEKVMPNKAEKIGHQARRSCVSAENHSCLRCGGC